MLSSLKKMGVPITILCPDPLIIAHTIETLSTDPTPLNTNQPWILSTKSAAPSAPRRPRPTAASPNKGYSSRKRTSTSIRRPCATPPSLMLVGINPGGNGHKGIWRYRKELSEATYNAYVDLPRRAPLVHPALQPLRHAVPAAAAGAVRRAPTNTSSTRVRQWAAPRDRVTPHGDHAGAQARRRGDRARAHHNAGQGCLRPPSATRRRPHPCVRRGALPLRLPTAPRRPDDPVGYLCNPSPRNARYFAGGEDGRLGSARSNWFLTELH